MLFSRRPLLVGPGDVLSERYRISRLLGEGGIALVYVAYDLVLQRMVAVKTLRPNLALSRRAQRRLEREARAAVRLHGRNVARIYDVKRLRNGSPYMVMEYLEGHDLRVELRRRCVLPAHEAVDYVLQACCAMQEAHAAGIIHRDLKPSNLLLCDVSGRRTVKVLDFGIAKDLELEDSVVTGTGHRLGTPRYMAPEQVLARRDIDGRVDVWALGMILYECLTGEYPFQVKGVVDMVQAIVQAEPRSIRSWGVPVSEGLAHVVHRALRKSPDQRYPDVDGLAGALLPFRVPTRGQAWGRGSEGPPATGGGSEASLARVRRSEAPLVTVRGAQACSATGAMQAPEGQSVPADDPDAVQTNSVTMSAGALVGAVERESAAPRASGGSERATPHDEPTPVVEQAQPAQSPGPVPRAVPVVAPDNRGAWAVLVAVTALVLIAIASSVLWVATGH